MLKQDEKSRLGSGSRHCGCQFRWPEAALRSSEKAEKRCIGGVGFV
jgi:hypothetical protein